MSYYDEMHKAKTRIRTTWIPKIIKGETINIDEILYDLDKSGIKYGEKAVIKYIKRICHMEGFLFDEEHIKK